MDLVRLLVAQMLFFSAINRMQSTRHEYRTGDTPVLGPLALLLLFRGGNVSC